MRRYHVEVKNHTLHEEHLIAIGLIVTEWSRLEAIVEKALWAWAEIDEYSGLVLTTHMSSENRLLALETFSFWHPSRRINEKDHKRLKSLLKKFRELRVRRNSVVHSVWMKNKNGIPKMYRFTARGKAIFIEGSQSVHRLVKLSNDINAFARKFFELVGKKFPKARSFASQQKSS